MDFDEIKAESLVLDESFQRYCAGTDSAAIEYWENWLVENQGKRIEFAHAKRLYTILNGGNDAEKFNNDRATFFDRLKQETIIEAAEAESKPVQLPYVNEPKGRFSIYRLFAAAAVLAAVLVGAYLLSKNNEQTEKLGDIKDKKNQKIDKLPGGNKATLILADGSTIMLDSAANGMISQQGGANVTNAGGQLTYKRGDKESEVLYNTITTPKGGQYKLLLSDGSKVWLNASSSLRFPSVFTGTERKVELQGEGYFEIAHNSSNPFHVQANDIDVEVLGTHFNIMAYADEESIKTTLVQGKVIVRKERIYMVLTPGQQAEANPEGTLILNKSADIEAAIAWKNGLFHFTGADMKTVMGNIGRWYNIETVIEGDMSKIHLSGKISRYLNLSQVIEALTQSGIEIKVERNKIIASPKP